MPMLSSKYHKPVLVQEILDFIPDKVQLIVDATCGTGGHSAAIAEKFKNLICLDFDCATLKVAQNRLEKLDKKIKFICDNFKNIKKILGKQKANFILADLGFSSWQLKSNRGLTFSKNQRLDMRMDKRLKITAAELINHLDKKTLADLIYKHSDERLSRQIAEAIVKKRPIYTTEQLAEIIKKAVGIRYKKNSIHPATRTFQALRITVNQELDSLEKFLSRAPSCLAKNGILAIITFHSLEERLVRDYFKKLKKTGKFQLLTPQPVSPTQKEIQSNPRSRSARLRVIKKLNQYS